MAIAYGHVTSINRRNGRSAVAAAAYRSASRLVDARTGRTCDYRRKGGVTHSEITAPAGCGWATDRQTLWGAAEATERRQDATTAREWLGALPHELPDDGRAAVCREFAAWLSERHGVAVDWSVHAPHDRPVTGGDEGRNWHTHMMFTSRRVTADGMGEKTRELDTKGTASGHVEAWRQRWAEIVNRHLVAASIESSIDMRIRSASSSATSAMMPTVSRLAFGMSTATNSTPPSFSDRRKAALRASRSSLAITSTAPWMRQAANASASFGRSLRLPLSTSVISATKRPGVRVPRTSP